MLGSATLTTAKFYSPNGYNLSKRGVKPDVTVEIPEEKHTTFYRGDADGVDLEHDLDLRAGINHLRTQYTRR